MYHAWRVGFFTWVCKIGTCMAALQQAYSPLSLSCHSRIGMWRFGCLVKFNINLYFYLFQYIKPKINLKCIVLNFIHLLLIKTLDSKKVLPLAFCQIVSWTQLLWRLKTIPNSNQYSLCVLNLPHHNLRTITMDKNKAAPFPAPSPTVYELCLSFGDTLQLILHVLN